MSQSDRKNKSLSSTSVSKDYIYPQKFQELANDAAGRRTSVTTNAGTTTLSWDYEDRLVGITYPSTATNAFSYNAFGARVSKTDSSGTSTYARNGVSVVAPVLSDGSRTYTPSISSRDGTNSTFSHGDIKNSLRQSGADESTIATTQYDAFGNTISSSGAWSGPFKYGGQFGYQTDTDSGLKLLGHRYYDPSTGRFICRDPAKHTNNWFCYVGSNPLLFADPLGLGWVQTAFTIGGGLIGGILTGGNPAGAALGAAIGGAIGSAAEQYRDTGRIDPGRAVADGVVDGAITFVGGRLMKVVMSKLLPVEVATDRSVKIIHYTTPQAAERIADEGFKGSVVYGWPKPVHPLWNFFFGSGTNRGATITFQAPADQVRRNMFGALIYYVPKP